MNGRGKLFMLYLALCSSPACGFFFGGGRNWSYIIILQLFFNETLNGRGRKLFFVFICKGLLSFKVLGKILFSRFSLAPHLRP